MSRLQTGHPKFQPHIPGLGSLRSKFILCFMVLGIIPMILLAFVSYRVYLDILQQNVQTYTSTVIDRVDRSLEIYLSDLERILELRNDYYHVQFIKLSLAGDIEGNRKYTFRLWENLNNIKQFKTDLRDVAITTSAGVSVGCYGVTHIDRGLNPLFQTLARQPASRDGMRIWEPHPDWLGGKVFTVGQAIRGDYDNFLGMMSIDVDVELLDRICRNIRLGKTGYVFLADSTDRIIYHPQPEYIGKPLTSLLGKSATSEWQPGFFSSKTGPEYRVITIKEFYPANWRIIGLSSQNELTAAMQKVTVVSLALIIASIAVLTLAAIALAGLLTRPMKKLQQSMRAAAEDLTTNVRIGTHDEIGELGEAFNQMIIRIRRLMEESVREQKKRRQTEMIALQEQIKPHFIYNTLDLIIGLLETNKNEDVINMVEALGAFFRISLSHGQEFIAIRDEVEHVRNYLYIQRFRHGDGYDYEITMEERVLDKKTIKLILQPLVENAIYHGVRELEHPGGLITVVGYCEGEHVSIKVIDNGKGMDGATVTEINRCLNGAAVSDERRFFGLRNVNDRIQLAFGKDYGLRLESAVDQGTVVTVHLPLIVDKPKE